MLSSNHFTIGRRNQGLTGRIFHEERLLEFVNRVTATPKLL